MTSSKLKSSKSKNSKSPKIYTGKRGGKYILKDNKKVYLSSMSPSPKKPTKSPKKPNTKSAKISTKKKKYTKRNTTGKKKRRLSWGFVPKKRELAKLKEGKIEYVPAKTDGKTEHSKRSKRKKRRSILRKPAKFPNITEPYPSKDEVEKFVIEDGLAIMKKYNIIDQKSYQSWYNKKYLPSWKKANSKKTKDLEYNHHVVSECIQHGIFYTP